MFPVQQFVFLVQSFSEVWYVVYISSEMIFTIEQRVFIVKTYTRKKNLQKVYLKISS
jgi:hypothetical protein